MIIPRTEALLSATTLCAYAIVKPKEMRDAFLFVVIASTH